MLFEGDVGADCPNFAESFSKRWLKRWRKKGRETRESARVSTGFFEVGIQTIDLFLFEFLIKGGVDAQRDRDVLVAHLVAGGHDVHTGEVHQSAEGMAELVRGKTGRVYGDLMGTLTMLKGLPLAYNKDMQEDKESIFDAFDTVSHCLEVFTPMLKTMKTRKNRMYKAAQEGFINATDLADYLTRKGMPFRAAYKLTGALVAECIRTGQVLETVPLERYKELSELFDEDVYEAINLKNCVEKRISEGGTGKASVLAQIQYIRSIL
ncbi:MAG: hypothetical protein EGQ09_12680 [Clostridiales bacterium]|nr:hypothetical protein [Clostridiales bacterium]